MRGEQQNLVRGPRPERERQVQRAPYREDPRPDPRPPKAALNSGFVPTDAREPRCYPQSSDSLEVTAIELRNSAAVAGKAACSRDPLHRQGRPGQVRSRCSPAHRAPARLATSLPKTRHAGWCVAAAPGCKGRRRPRLCPLRTHPLPSWLHRAAPPARRAPPTRARARRPRPLSCARLVWSGAPARGR